MKKSAYLRCRRELIRELLLTPAIAGAIKDAQHGRQTATDRMSELADEMTSMALSAGANHRLISRWLGYCVDVVTLIYASQGNCLALSIYLHALNDNRFIKKTFDAAIDTTIL